MRLKRTAAYIGVILLGIAMFQEGMIIAFGSNEPAYVVVSGSMIPTLNVGDMVLVQKVPYPSINVGDVVVYIQPVGDTCKGISIVHRVVSISAQGIITQGDNRLTNPNSDPWLTPPHCIVGKVILAIPYLGKISMAVRPPWNYLLVLAVLFLVVLMEKKGGDASDKAGRAKHTPRQKRA